MQRGTVGFIGAGNMARSLIGGLRVSGVDGSRIIVADPVAEQLTEVKRQHDVRVCSDNTLVARGADLLVLAVKPQDMPGVATGIASALSDRRPLIISVAAGVRVDALSGWLGGYDRIVRTMPNRPALLRKGVTALYAPATVAEDQRLAAQWLMASVGVAVWVDREELLDAVTAVSGSGPAYFFLLTELLESAALELGLPPEVARTLAIETAYGAACMAHAGIDTPQRLREQVTSRGGTTAAALRVLEEADLRGIVARAVAAACRRSAELAAESGR